MKKLNKNQKILALLKAIKATNAEIKALRRIEYKYKKELDKLIEQK